MDTIVRHEQRQIGLSFTVAIVHLDHVRPGTIDLPVGIEPPSEETTVARCLRLRLPGLEAWLAVSERHSVPGGVILSFCASDLTALAAVAGLAEVSWAIDDAPIGQVPCVRM